jgi:hypothetical protein
MSRFLVRGVSSRMVAGSAADLSHLRSRHVEFRPRSKPEQYIRMGDEARYPRRSPRHDLTRLAQGEIRGKATRLGCLRCWLV